MSTSNQPQELETLIKQLCANGSEVEARAAVETLRERGLWWNGALFRADLSGADLRHASLDGAYLREVDLRDAKLHATHLSGAFLNNSTLISAELPQAQLRGADLSNAQLRAANLLYADLRDAKLNGADLRSADLRGANLTNASLSEANFKQAYCAGTIFANVDLSTVKDLETVRHRGPSFVSVDTLYRSRGMIPEAFLRGCGVPPDFIQYSQGLFGLKAVQFYNCLIHYSHADQDFALRLHHRLYDEGINCWLTVHDASEGKLKTDEIVQEISNRQKLVICCSANALNRPWFDREVTSALQMEEAITQQPSLILPLDLDGFIFKPECRSAVAPLLRERLTADFTDRTDHHDAFERGVRQVIRALRTSTGTAPLTEG